MSHDVPQRISLSITSHTNIGKTTLVRTLLRRDVGKVLDQAHVTDQNEKFTWLETQEGEKLEVWDTPGFGNSVQLLRLLEKQENPIGWMIAHVWDRFNDRPLWCSQQALKNVRDEADVVLYLVNALEEPTLASGYINPELAIIEWLQKPTLVVLNQMGPESDPEERKQRERDWHACLQKYSVVRGVVSLDSFSRCWVLEGVLLEHVQAILPTSSQPSMARLGENWKRQNCEIFKNSMARIAEVISRAVYDQEEVSGTGQTRKAKVKHAAEKLRHRLEQGIWLAVQDLINWHGLEGGAAIKIQAQLHDLTVPMETSVMEEALGRAALGGFGGAAAGTATGAAIDAATGGMSLGLFALTGAFLGALGLAAWGNEIETAETLKIKWVPKYLDTLTQDLLLRYLAVAHFGRGQGIFRSDNENPLVWKREIQEGYEAYHNMFQAFWSTEDHEQEVLQKQLSPILETLTKEVLLVLYPATKEYLNEMSGN